MTKLNQKQQKIIALFLEKGSLQSSDIHSELTKGGEDISLVTIKRALAEMAKEGILADTGAGRSTAYRVSALGRIFANINHATYCALDPDNRYGLKSYNFDLLQSLPIGIFTNDETQKMDRATIEYKKRSNDVSPALQKKELERLVIELSWKSSKIEGNTYTLLDTEKLILENTEAPGHSKREAQMILNHKDAFLFIRKNAKKYQTLTRTNLEELHAILVKDLSVGMGLRKKPVGVVGSIYRPLDNGYQIEEAVAELCRAVTRMETPYAKAMIALLGTSYIQPFEDGNKRTARLMANAILLANGYAPLSYRSVDEKEYRDVMLVFYEINSILPFRKIFVEQYDFAAKNYGVKAGE